MKLLSFICFMILIVCKPLSMAEVPNCSHEKYRQFDFWVGNWQVHTLDGQYAGSNNVTAQEGNCLVHEQWRSTGGGTGQSFNYFQPASKRWHQLWVSQGAVIDYSGNLNDEGSMELEGIITYRADNRAAKFRGVWTPKDDGTVLQQLQEWDDKSGTWTEWFTGVYSLKQG